MIIHILRKPLTGTVTANVLTHGCGALNIDGCRIGTAADVPAVHAIRKSDYPQSHRGDGPGWGRSRGGRAGDMVAWTPKAGRWPANFVHDGSADPLFPVTSSGKMMPTHTVAGAEGGRLVFGSDAAGGFTTMETYGDCGCASRFFQKVDLTCLSQTP